MKKVLKFLYNALGIKYIYEKKIIETPSTFFIWLLGIHAALFTLAQGRHENHSNRLDNKTSIIYNQVLVPDIRRSALERIPKIQKYLMPKEPDFFKFWTVYQSLFGKKSIVWENVNELTENILIWKDSLDSLELNGIMLCSQRIESLKIENSYLGFSNLSNSQIYSVKGKSSRLFSSNLSNTRITNADFSESIFNGANFEGANLSWVNFNNALLYGANFKDAYLHYCDLTNAKLGTNLVKKKRNDTIRYDLIQLLNTKSLYGTKLDSNVYSYLYNKKPELFKQPTYIIEMKVDTTELTQKKL